MEQVWAIVPNHRIPEIDVLNRFLNEFSDLEQVQLDVDFDSPAGVSDITKRVPSHIKDNLRKWFLGMPVNFEDFFMSFKATLASKLSEDFTSWHFDVRVDEYQIFIPPNSLDPTMFRIGMADTPLSQERQELPSVKLSLEDIVDKGFIREVHSFKDHTRIELDLKKMKKHYGNKFGLQILDLPVITTGGVEHKRAPGKTRANITALVQLNKTTPASCTL